MPQNLTEFQIIEKFFKPLANNFKASQGLEDDVAKISLKEDEELVISKDLAVQDVHFLLSDGGFKIASKILRANLSDLASSGATPKYYSLGFTKTPEIDKNFIKEFSKGLKSIQDEFSISLIGGDTVRAKQLIVSITVFGVTKEDKTLSRSNAKSGDLIFVSGSIGDAYLGLQLNDLNVPLSEVDKNYLLNRHFFPTPRIKLGQEILDKNLSKCAIDISDGLLADLSHICKSSKLSAKIYQELFPFSAQSLKVIKNDTNVSLLDLVSAGDDYELIFTSSKKNHKKIIDLSNLLKVNLTCIGEICESVDKSHVVTLFDKSGDKVKIKKYGYEH